MVEIAASELPIEVVNEDLLADVFGILSSLDAITKDTLIKKIDRRNRGVWGRIKRELLE